MPQGDCWKWGGRLVKPTFSVRAPIVHAVGGDGYGIERPEWGI